MQCIQALRLELYRSSASDIQYEMMITTLVACWIIASIGSTVPSTAPAMPSWLLLGKL